MTCKTNADGSTCLVTDANCKSPFELTKNGDSCYIESLVNESINIAGAELHVFKLLGVTEQGKLMDLTGNGKPISGGDTVNFPANNAFMSNNTEWKSFQRGSNVTLSSYLGYNFGPVKLENGRNKYGINAPIRHNIATIAIQQGINTINRITKARIEYSDDNTLWKGLAIITLPDDADEHNISYKSSITASMWRIRPLNFNGGINDPWIVKKLQMFDYQETRIDQIEGDFVFLENRNRNYANESITLKAPYDLVDAATELLKFGIDVPSQQFYFQIPFNSCIAALGRPTIIGDIIEMPSEVQYSASMEAIKKYVEVTDVAWSTNGYTPGWKPTILRVIAQPAMASQETQQIFGDLSGNIDTLDVLNVDTSKYQDYVTISEEIGREAKNQVPEHGADTSAIGTIPADIIAKGLKNGIDLRDKNVNPNNIYVEDALPPNGASYTESDTFPTMGLVDGVYHRLTYSGLAEDVPPRLYRWSAAKVRWIFLETDGRFNYNKVKPTASDFLKYQDKIPNDKTGK